MKGKDEQTNTSGASKASELVHVHFEYGNRHRVLQESRSKRYDNTHEWTIFVKFKDKKLIQTSLIDKVRFHLHPSFGFEHVDVRTPNSTGYYEKTFTGYGTFNIPILIFFRRDIFGIKEERQMKLFHQATVFIVCLHWLIKFELVQS